MSGMDIPTTLHGQLYLAAYDNARHRTSGRIGLLEFALRAAMLTDLYLTGHITDLAGTARQAATSPPDDPLLRAVFFQIGHRELSWANLITHSRGVECAVQDQLVGDGHLRERRQHLPRLLSRARTEPTDIAAAELLAERAGEAVRRAVLGLPTEPQPLAIGLLAEQAQLDTVLSPRESARCRTELRHLIDAAIAPITALHQVIEEHHEKMRRSSGGP